MIVSVNNRTYRVGNKVYRNMLQLAKEKFKTENKWAIYAIEKRNITEMRKDEFESEEALMEQVKVFKSKGFLVYYTRREQDE